MKTFKWADKYDASSNRYSKDDLILKVISFGNLFVFISLFSIIIFVRIYILTTGDIDARWILVLIAPFYIPATIIMWVLGTASLFYRNKLQKKLTILVAIINQLNLLPILASMYLTIR